VKGKRRILIERYVWEGSQKSKIASWWCKCAT